MTNNLQICAIKAGGLMFYQYTGSGSDITSLFRLLCTKHALEFRGQKLSKEEGRIVRSISISRETWGEAVNIVNKLKEMGELKSTEGISNLIEILLNAFIESHKTTLEQIKEEKNKNE